MIDSIYVTLGADQIKERPYREHIEDFKKCDGERGIYWWRLGNRPTKEFVWVYIVIGNKVRWKARFLDWGGNGWMDFDDNRQIYAKQWMLFSALRRLHLLNKIEEIYEKTDI